MKRYLKHLGIATLTLIAAPALADSIDGDWCFNDGRNFTIKGSEIVTPTGKHVKGDYSRHSFDYVVPTPEPDAGTKVRMMLMGEFAVQVVAASGKSETWRRCELKSS